MSLSGRWPRPLPRGRRRGRAVRAAIRRPRGFERVCAREDDVVAVGVSAAAGCRQVGSPWRDGGELEGQPGVRHVAASCQSTLGLVGRVEQAGGRHQPCSSPFISSGTAAARRSARGARAVLHHDDQRAREAGLAARMAELTGSREAGDVEVEVDGRACFSWTRSLQEVVVDDADRCRRATVSVPLTRMRRGRSPRPGLPAPDRPSGRRR